ncbi:MAG: glycerate kinase [Cyanobacteria bacterium]|nr:glycerate kinase [Cyanobacteriota bacterium]
MSAEAVSNLLYQTITESIEVQYQELAQKIDLKLIQCPLADGGDDTLEAMKTVFSNTQGLQAFTTSVMGPIPSMTVEATYLIEKTSHIGFIEAAQAHGYQHLPTLPNGSKQTFPLQATSYGVGALLQHCLKEHPDIQEWVITLGGSASTDGGAGCLQALGYVFFDMDGNPIPSPVAGGDLSKIHQVVAPLTPKNTSHVQYTVLTDVENPLLGPQGSAFTFSPQKGASPQEILLLERGLEHLAQALTQMQEANQWPSISPQEPRMGAAGGLSFALSHLPNTKVQSGFQWISQKLNLSEKLSQSDLILTGEGSFDAQSFQGKVIGGLVEMMDFLEKKIPLWVVCGGSSFSEETLPIPSGIASEVRIFPLVSQPEKNPEALQAALTHPEDKLRETLQNNLVPAFLGWLKEKIASAS